MDVKQSRPRRDRDPRRRTMTMACRSDFNIIASMDECLGPVQQDIGTMADFTDTLSTYGLNQIPAFGSRFTWIGVCQGRQIWKKLDRILVN